jgi:hypothetical protein
MSMHSKPLVVLALIAGVFSLNSCSSVDHSLEIANCEDLVEVEAQQYTAFGPAELEFSNIKFDELGGGKGRITGDYAGGEIGSGTFECAADGAIVTVINY